VPLKITNPVEQVASLNRWADWVESQLKHQQTHIAATNRIAVTASPVTNVTNNITGATDGLVHGDLVWEHDPAYVELRDDFVTGTTADQNIGELGWNQMTSNGAFQHENSVYIPGMQNVGMIGMYPNSTLANDYAGISYGAGNSGNTIDGIGFSTGAMPLLDYPGWKCTYVFQFRRRSAQFAMSGAFNITKMSAYIGLFNCVNNNSGEALAGRPEAFIGVRYDTDTTSPSINDTTFWLEACFNAQNFTGPVRYNQQGTHGGAADTLMTPVEGRWYRLDIVCSIANSITLTLSGGGQTFSTTFTLSYPIIGYLPPFGSANVFAPSSPTYAVSKISFSPGTLDYQNGVLGYGGGSLVGLSGFSVPGNDGTYVVLGTISSGIGLYVGSALTGELGTSPVYATGYPALIPFAVCGNDTAGSAPTAGSRMLCIDYFSLVWNGGLAGTTTVNPKLSRYW
jgi:hypothetical protein